jgi:hypothetical protein
MTRFRATALCALALGPLYPAQAQDTGHLIERYKRAEIKKNKGVDEAQRVMFAYAECVAKAFRGQVERYLATFPGSSASDQMALRIAADDCLGSGELRFQPDLFRGALYQALYQRSFKGRFVDISDAPAVDYGAGRETADPDVGAIQVELRQFGDCVVRRDQKTARDLVMSRINSDAEDSAFANLGPSLNACLVQGSQLRFSRSVLRGLTAETLYRLSAAKGAATGAAEGVAR